MSAPVVTVTDHAREVIDEAKRELVRLYAVSVYDSVDLAGILTMLCLLAVCLILWAACAWRAYHGRLRGIRKNAWPREGHSEHFFAPNSRCHYPQDLPERCHNHLHRAASVVPLRRRPR